MIKLSSHRLCKADCKELSWMKKCPGNCSFLPSVVCSLLMASYEKESQLQPVGKKPPGAQNFEMSKLL